MELSLQGYLTRADNLLPAESGKPRRNSPLHVAALLREEYAVALANDDDVTAHAIIELQEVALATGENAAKNVVIIGFLEGPYWQTPPLDEAWRTWPAYLHTAMLKQRAAVEDAIAYERQSVRDATDPEAPAGDAFAG